MSNKDEGKIIYLDGESLTPNDLYAIGEYYHDNNKIIVAISDDTYKRVQTGRDVVNNVIERKEIVYGINTGFGNFAHVLINENELNTLQNNLIMSHAAGVGEPLDLCLTRMLLALRINVLCKGHSGIRVETLKQLLAALNKNCLSYIPSKGTVGASGDLAPLSHLALGLLGQGQMWNPTLKYDDALHVLTTHDLKPLNLQAQEGLALINGTQLIVAIGVKALCRAENIARQADIVAGISLEALKGSIVPFHPSIHRARPHKGQQLTAGRLRCLLNWGGKKI